MSLEEGTIILPFSIVVEISMVLCIFSIVVWLIIAWKFWRFCISVKDGIMENWNLSQ